MKHTNSHFRFAAAPLMVLMAAVALGGCAHKQTAAVVTTPPAAALPAPHPIVPVMVEAPSNLVEATPEMIGLEILSKRPVLVMICTDKIGSCRVQKPILEKVAADYQGRVKFFTVDPMDSDDNKELAIQMGVRSRMDMPMFYYFKDGGVVLHYDGVLDDEELRKGLDGGLSGELKPHHAPQQPGPTDADNDDGDQDAPPPAATPAHPVVPGRKPGLPLLPRSNQPINL